jgi:hypothetical protein
LLPLIVFYASLAERIGMQFAAIVHHAFGRRLAICSYLEVIMLGGNKRMS